MQRRAKTPDTLRIASNRQFWRLNVLGRLTLTKPGEALASPIRAHEAGAIIADALELSAGRDEPSPTRAQ
jgi:hypothetical protein